MGKDASTEGNGWIDVGEALTPPVWSLDGQFIYVPAMIRGDQPLLAIPVSEEAGEPRRVIKEPGVVGGFSFDASQERVAALWGFLSSTAQVAVKEKSKPDIALLTQFNQDLLSQVDLCDIEEVNFTGPSGDELDGWILKPPGFDPGQKYPSILEIHGGPLAQYGHYFMHEFHYLAAQGYVVYFSNPRGGQGYGEEHARAIWGRWGSRDYEDIMAWTDYVAAQPYIDKERMGVTGGSYGGYMTCWIIGHTDRFAAAAAQRTVTNFISMWGSSDMNWHFQLLTGSDQAPFENVQQAWDRSPMKYIGNATTPTLLIHSEQDLRTPIEQSEQAYVALKRLGVDTEFVRFPGESHGLSRIGRTDRRIVRLNHILRWMDKYLKAESSGD